MNVVFSRNAINDGEDSSEEVDDTNDDEEETTRIASMYEEFRRYYSL